MKGLKLILLLLSFLAVDMTAQEERIMLSNASFEDMSRHSKPPMGWFDCGMEGETAPDVQPGWFNVNKVAQEGNTYLGLVTRDNETWEAVGQRLSSPIVGGNCYQFRIYLAYSDEYFSLSRTTLKDEFFIKPVTLRIWAGNGYCDKRELLASSDLVNSTDWSEHTFKFKPKRDYKHIVLEAFYKTPTLFPYNGNLLVDNASDIILMGKCEDEIDDELFDKDNEPIASNDNINKPKPKPPKPDPKPDPTPDPDPVPDPYVDNNPIYTPPPTPSDPVKEPEIMTELADVSRMKEGQTIRIKQLDFQADKSNILEGMHKVLNEIYDFLSANPKVSIEIGGHTNTLPSHDYCNWLSENRASAVANYLIGKGLDEKRISFKGYGKTNPIDTSKTVAGRRKNQRVEIKIISLD